MKNDLLINGKDAFTTWGVSMGKGFVGALNQPAPLKPFIETKSRLEHGKKVVCSNQRLDERDITLSFVILGSSESDYQKKRDLFFNELLKGEIDIQVPREGSKTFHLIYTGRNVSFTQGLSRRAGRISCRFNEPNPANRT